MPLIYDIHIELLPATDQSVHRGVMTYGFNRTISLAGLQRLINRFLLEFLTEEGSDPTDLRRGTPFVRLIGSNISDAQGIREVTEISVQKASDRLRRYQVGVDNYTDEDRLRSAELTGIVYDDANAAVAISIRLENVAGRKQTVQVPLRQDG